MNADILKGQWKEIKGDVKTKWGKLTDDDLTQIEGAEEKLIGTLQKRYGYARDEAEREYNAFMKSRGTTSSTKTHTSSSSSSEYKY